MATLNEMILDTIKTSASKTPKYFSELMQNNSLRLEPDSDSKKWVVYLDKSNARIFYKKRRGAELNVYVCVAWKRNLTKSEKSFLCVNLDRYTDKELYQARRDNRKYLIPVEVEYRKYEKSFDGQMHYRYIFEWESKIFSNLSKWRTYSYEPLETICDMRKNLRYIKLNERDIECTYEYIENHQKSIKRHEMEINDMNENNARLKNENEMILDDARQRRMSKSIKVS